MRTLDFLNAPGLPKPAGHYSHAVVHGGIAYLAVILVEQRVLHYLPKRAVGGI